MTKLLIVTLLLFAVCTTAQNTSDASLKKSTVLLHAGPSFHGTGDIWGFRYGISLERSWGTHWIWGFSFDGGINDREERPFIFEDPSGNIINSTKHDVISGFQFTPSIGFRFINKKHHRLAVHPGLIIRYQASSLNDVETTLFPIITGVPFPIRIIENNGNNRTWAVGGVLRLQYDYLIQEKYLLGLQTGWQTDTNGDAITHATLRFGYSF